MNKEGLTVLSLFDGMSCGQIALERSGIKIKKYFASEIKNHAIKVTKYNYPNTIHIGDVKKIQYENGILYTENGVHNVGKIDLLIGGSPCQDFSPAKYISYNKYKYGLNGDKSSLFYEYLRLLKEVQPTYFLLENVKMKNDSKKQLDEFLNVEGIYINSELVSYQKRPRFYWTNIGDIVLPENKNINFQDYKESSFEICKEYRLKEHFKSHVQMWNNGKGRIAAYKGDNTNKYCENITYSDKVYCLTTRQTRSPNSGLIEFDGFCRYLTRRELEQAQTVPIGYTDILSYNQAQNVLGDGWTVDVIAHIFSFLPNTYKFDELHTYNDLIYSNNQEEIINRELTF